MNKGQQVFYFYPCISIRDSIAGFPQALEIVENLEIY